MEVKFLTPNSFWLILLVTRGLSFYLSSHLGGALPAKNPLTSVCSVPWCVTEETQMQVPPARRASLHTPLVGSLSCSEGPTAAAGPQASVLMGMETVSPTQTTPCPVL